jgi:hypothetical protein
MRIKYGLDNNFDFWLDKNIDYVDLKQFLSEKIIPQSGSKIFNEFNPVLQNFNSMNFSTFLEIMLPYKYDNIEMAQCLAEYFTSRVATRQPPWYPPVDNDGYSWCLIEPNGAVFEISQLFEWVLETEKDKLNSRIKNDLPFMVHPGSKGLLRYPKISSINLEYFPEETLLFRLCKSLAVFNLIFSIGLKTFDLEINQEKNEFIFTMWKEDKNEGRDYFQILFNNNGTIIKGYKKDCLLKKLNYNNKSAIKIFSDLLKNTMPLEFNEFINASYNIHTDQYDLTFCMWKIKSNQSWQTINFINLFEKIKENYYTQFPDAQANQYKRESSIFSLEDG